MSEHNYGDDDNYGYGGGYYGGGSYDDDDDGDRDNYGDEIPEHTYKDQQRTDSGIIPCWVTDSSGQPLKTQDSLGRFCLAVDAISRKINEKNVVNLGNPQIQILLTKSQELRLVEYKNPTAFVLGYISTSGGNHGITKKSLELAWKCYKSYTDTKKTKSVQKPDIIRYARMWENK